MKRLTLTTAVLAILMAPAAFAQSTLNTTAPGPSQETKPGQTNNNLQNPGSKMQPAPQSTAPESTTGTMSNDTTGTATSTDTTGTTTGTTYNSTTPTPPTDTTTGSMNNSTTGTGATGAYTGSTSTSTTTSSSLPKTASDLPTVAMAGLLALFAAFALRFYSKRNA